MKSSAYFLILAFLLIVSVGRCQFNTSGRQTDAPAAQHLHDTIPDNIGETDLLDLLQGKWASDSIPTDRIEVREETIRFYSNRTVVQAGSLVIDSHCTLATCFDSLSLDNWCFIVEQANEQRCYRVLTCSPDSLRFQAAGSDGRINRYHRLD